MTRKAFDHTTGKQVAILPAEHLKITQGPIPAKDGFTVSNSSSIFWSHLGYHAIDHCNPDDINFYAPFDMVCVKHEYRGNACFTFFTSLEEVLCAADNIPSYVSMVCIHGGSPIINGEDKNGNPVDKLDEEVIIRQGNQCYQWGNEGISSGPHIHFEVMKGKLPINFNYSSYMKTYMQTDSNNNKFPADGFINGTYAEDIFYKLPSDIVEFVGTGSYWKEHINFKTYTPVPFSPAGKEDGEYEYEGDHYYVINQDFAYGWQPETAEPDMQKYYDKSNGGRRIDNNWAGYYYFTDENGFIRKNQWVEKPAADWFYLGDDGKFVTGWQFVKRSNTSTSEAWFYFNLIGVQDENGNYQDGYVPTLPAGQMLREEWIAGKDDEGNVLWYYVKAGGEMAANETVNINGIEYRFDANGVCLNP